MEYTIKKFDVNFLQAMVASAYKFDASVTKTIDDPIMTNAELLDYYCGFCGSPEKPVQIADSWPYCPDCHGV